jgi:hypothetical protein
MEYLIDCGMPMAASIRPLSKIVKKPTLTEKIANKLKPSIPTDSLESLLTTLESKSQMDSAVLWKDTTSKYSNNICNMEIVEKLSCILDNEGNIVDSHVEGIVYSTCIAQGSPEISLTFKSVYPTTDHCLHKLALNANGAELFKNSNIIRYFPNDSCIELLGYSLDNPPMALPFKIDYSIGSKSVNFTINTGNIRIIYAFRSSSLQ